MALAPLGVAQHRRRTVLAHQRRALRLDDGHRIAALDAGLLAILARAVPVVPVAPAVAAAAFALAAGTVVARAILAGAVVARTIVTLAIVPAAFPAVALAGLAVGVSRLGLARGALGVGGLLLLLAALVLEIDVVAGHELVAAQDLAGGRCGCMARNRRK